MAQTSIRFTFEVAPGNMEETSEGHAPAISLDVLSFELEEALNDPFCLSLELISHDADIDFDSVLNHPAVFTIYQQGQPARYVHGVVSHFEIREAGFRRTRYFAIVEPVLSYARITGDWRIFQQKNCAEILRDVFRSLPVTDVGINSQLHHATREYCVQPGVLTFDFIQRISAEEGYVYRIDCTASGHRLLLTDIIQTFGTIASNSNAQTQEEKGEGDHDDKNKIREAKNLIIYNPNTGGDRPQPALRSFTYSQSVRTALQTSRDYTFKNPRYSLEHKAFGADVAHNTAIYERYDYGTHARYKRDEAGKPFTQTKIQALRNDARVAVSIGDDARIQPGLAFLLQGHQRESLNVYWRPVRVTHKGTQHTASEEEAATTAPGTSYEQRAELVLATDNWKADIPPPHKIEGPLIAHVTAPEGEEIYCDEFGRVKVIFPWQRNEQPNEHSSCWIRVAQNWAGAGWGHMALPRAGDEVIVDFLHGDESEPIIIGRTYDAMHPAPYKVPALKTQATIKSKEHKGEGYNELLIDDTTGEIKTQLHSSHGATQLNLGYLTHPRKTDGSGDYRGEGFELRTDSWGAIRAGHGLYISADKREKAEGKQLDLQEAIDQLETALNIAKDLADAAQASEAALAADTADQEKQLAGVYTDLVKPGLLASAPEGIAIVTPQSAQVSAYNNVTVTSIKNTDITANENFTVAAKESVSLFSAQDDMRLVAGQGKVRMQANDNDIEIFADKTLKVVSTQDKIEITGEKEILLTSGGAYIRIKDGNIDIHAPGTIEHRGASFPYWGPTALGIRYNLPKVNVDPLNFQSQGVFILSSHPAGRGRLYRNEPYKLYEDGNLMQEGLTDDKAAITYERRPEAQYRVELVSGHTFNIETMPSSSDRKDILAYSLGQMGFRYFEGEYESCSFNKPTDQLLAHYFHKKPQSDKKQESL